MTRTTAERRRITSRRNSRRVRIRFTWRCLTTTWSTAPTKPKPPRSSPGSRRLQRALPNPCARGAGWLFDWQQGLLCAMGGRRSVSHGSLAICFRQRAPEAELNHGAGLDVSPAVRDFLGMNGMDVTDWKFVDFDEVPSRPVGEVRREQYFRAKPPEVRQSNGGIDGALSGFFAGPGGWQPAQARDSIARQRAIRRAAGETGRPRNRFRPAGRNLRRFAAGPAGGRRISGIRLRGPSPKRRRAATSTRWLASGARRFLNGSHVA